jgi:plasmid stability protein
VAQVLIRNVDDAVVARLKARAAARQQPLEAHLRDILVQAAGLTPAEKVELLRDVQARAKKLPPGAPTAEALVREDRHTR